MKSGPKTGLKSKRLLKSVLGDIAIIRQREMPAL